MQYASNNRSIRRRPSVDRAICWKIATADGLVAQPHSAGVALQTQTFFLQNVYLKNERFRHSHRHPIIRAPLATFKANATAMSCDHASLARYAIVAW
jgi:hypothetical protein